jgi:pyruvate/2-oxoglutarate dehydrogenase complex dihydrolipoamide dehydrogenase (E3) component
VVGGGTGGNYSAVLAANLGKKVALIERDKLAGTCVNYGCTPTKSIFYSSSLYAQFKNSEQFGIEFDNLRVDFGKVMARTRKIVTEARTRNEKRVEEHENMTLFTGSGKFVNENEVEVGGESVTGDTIFIATGASPFILPIEGLDKVDYLTYKTILELNELPKSIIIIGGGFIGLEYAASLNLLGSKVTILQRGNKIIKNSDGEISASLAEYLIEDGIDIRFGTEAAKVEQEGDEVVITTKDGKTIKGEKLLMAVGLKPNTPELNLEACGVKVNQRGFIEVDDFLRTSNKNIYSFGDVLGKKMFTHAALRQVEIVVKNAFSDANVKFDETIMPYAVFTEPEIGSVGLTEEEAQEKGIKFEIKKAYYSDTSRGIIGGEKRGFVKLIHNDKDILGCHIIGSRAPILVHEITALMNCQNSYWVLKEVIHTHPTLPEIFDDLAG